MYLILVMARTISPTSLKKSEKKLPAHDLKPVLVAINRKEPEYFVREHDSRRSGTKQDAAYKDIPRVFCRLSECTGTCKKDSEDALAGGRAQMAVFLATVVLPADAIEPEGDDFSQYVAERSRVADRIVVIGYTDDRLSMRKSEALALERARAVKRILEKNGIKAPITVVARPKCNYAKSRKLSNRVEVAALFFGSGGGKDAPAKRRGGRKGKKAAGSRGSKREAANE